MKNEYLPAISKAAFIKWMHAHAGIYDTVRKTVEEAKPQQPTLHLTDEHCICIYDQYGGAINPNCLIHGRKCNLKVQQPTEYKNVR